jgi:hypothetical protein
VQPYICSFKFFMLKKGIVFFLLFIQANLFAQHRTTHANMLWFNYNNNISFSSKWSLANDVQIRTRNWADRWSQFALRTGVGYKVNDKLTVTAGMAWFSSVRYSNNKPVFPNEWRPWQEVAYRIPGKKIDFSQRLRTEQRFLQRVVSGRKTDEYVCRFRLRYRFEFSFPLRKDRINASIGNEVMINPGHAKDSLFFDQNRTFFIADFKLNKSTTFQFQFIKLFQWQASDRILDDQNVFRFSIHQKFNFRRKKQ